MRLLQAAWKALLLLGLLTFAASSFFLARHVQGLLTDAAPEENGSGPASVDGLLNGLANTMDKMDKAATGAGIGSANPLRQGADKLRALQHDLGGAQQGFDTLSGTLDNALGGAGSGGGTLKGGLEGGGLEGIELGDAEPRRPADGAEARGPQILVQRPTNQKSTAQKSTAPKPVTPKPGADKHPPQSARHRPSRVE